MRNTIRNVTIVVPVLITSCHVSLKPKCEPKSAHTTIITAARMKVAGRPEMWAVHFVSRVNHVRDLVGLMVAGCYHSVHPLNAPQVEARPLAAGRSGPCRCRTGRRAGRRSNAHRHRRAAGAEPRRGTDPQSGTNAGGAGARHRDSLHRARAHGPTTCQTASTGVLARLRDRRA